MRKTETLIRLTPEAKEQLKILAARYGLSLSDTVAKLIFSANKEKNND